ncbi:hypothetical protein F4805DRAFT_423186 [Annulohypoxylon moriforme]|nr:hypothetical protein F4805DRAFT_423186 [Annulohypoxylon moriforme]
MVIRVLMLIYRKPELTPEQFRKHYEEIHMPLTRKVAGNTFPLSHIRRYIPRSTPTQQSPTNSDQYPAIVAGGEPEAVHVDCVTELIFRDKQHLQSYFEMPHAPGAAAQLEEEAKNFAAKYPTVIVEDWMETRPRAKL